jgi:hypothetical protein
MWRNISGTLRTLPSLVAPSNLQARIRTQNREHRASSRHQQSTTTCFSSVGALVVARCRHHSLLIVAAG